jgi:outer membrane protein
MNLKKFIFLSLAISGFCVTVRATDMPLFEALKQAEKSSPKIASDKFLQEASSEEIKIQKSKYYPELNAAVIASTGNPGSFALMDVDSDISAANRVGAGGALILKQDIWDFGRTSHAVETAELQQQLTRQQNSLSQLDIDHEVLRTYLDCSFLKTQIANSRKIVSRTKILTREMDRYVRSGQKSIIGKYLMEAEEKSAETRVAEFSERLKINEVRLSQLLGQRAEVVSCQNLASVDKDVAKMRGGSSSPVLEAQKTRSQIAQAKLSQARAEQMPQVFGMAMAGFFDSDRLKDRDNYAVGVGVSIPLFAGYRIDSRVGKESAQLKAEQASLDFSQQQIDQANSKYDERIQSLQVRLKFLEEEETQGSKVLDLAHKRYEDLQGNMSDLRDSIQNINRISLTADETRRDLLISLGEKSLFNGFVLETP